VQQTIIGQAQDIGIENKKSATEKEVLTMYENKTARYTFEGPLHLGAILAGCDNEKSLKALSEFAVPVGIAFQIQDDILGVFGNEKKIGKSVASDVEEGKLSLLVVKALNACSMVEKKLLNEILGKKNLTKENLKSFQEIIINAKSLAYSQQLAAKYFNAAEDKIEKIVMLPITVEFLHGLVAYLKGREI
jgi:geranylgeranyl diphosphate synthase type I